MAAIMDDITIPLHTSSTSNLGGLTQTANPLPQLLHTPTGLALLELQGTINLPARENVSISDDTDSQSKSVQTQTSIGRLVFPDYNPALKGEEDKAWMKRVYLYVGKHQRLTGEVKKLPRAIAVLRKRKVQQEELEVVEVVKWKILFSSRPEPVGAHEGIV